MSSGANGAGTDRDMEMLFRAVCGSISLSMKGSAARLDEAAHMAGRLSGKLDPKAARRLLRRAAQEIGYEPELIDTAIDREYARGEKEAIERGGGPQEQGDHPLPDPVSAATFAKVEPLPRQFIDGHELFLAKRLNVLTGAGAVGKSLLMLQLCCAYALKEETYPEASWLGRPMLKRGRVLYITTEDDLEECNRRVRDIAALEGIDISDLQQLDVIDMTESESRSLFQSPRKGILQRTQLLEELERRIAHGRYDLIIIDNRAQAVDADEIDRSVATKVGAVLDAIARRMGATIILLAHPSLSGIASGTGASGSTAWFNAVRNQVNMRQPEDADAKAPDDGRRELVSGKPNYGLKGRVIGLQWTAGAYVCTDQPERAGSDIGKADRAERVFLKLMREHISRGGTLSALSNARNYAPRIFFNNKTAREGVNLREMESAMNALLARGTIKTTVIFAGTQREKTILVIADE